MESKSLYAIKYVSQRTGLSPHLIRAWEKRYRAVVSQRSPKNRRLYSEKDVQRLHLLKKITDAGHSISQVAGLEFYELSNYDFILRIKQMSIQWPLKTRTVLI